VLTNARPPPVAEALFAVNLMISKTFFGYGGLAHDLVGHYIRDESTLQAGKQGGHAVEQLKRRFQA
jgi:hypothetical protein